MGKFPLTRIKDFLGRVAPFNTLDESELAELVLLMEIAYFPRGEVIIKAGGDPSNYLYIIHSGSVKVSIPANTDKEVLVDIRGEGDVFGAVSILSSNKALFSVTAREDLLTFLLPGNEFRNLVERFPEFQLHFNFSPARNLEPFQYKNGLHFSNAAGIESFPNLAGQMKSKVAELMSRKVLTCKPDCQIRSAANEMSRRNVGSMIIVSDSGIPQGILTDKDLRSRVIAADVSTSSPVCEVMSTPPLTISQNAFAFEAILDMTRHSVHHLVVTDGDRMTGIISDHDIKVVTGSSPTNLVKQIDYVSSIHELEKLPSHFKRLLDMLVRMGSSVQYMMDLLTEVLDRLTLKLFHVVEQTMVGDGLGGAPADYCWLTLNEAGRREQATPRYQSNALVYANVPADRGAFVKRWFIEFSNRVNEGLKTCGQYYCAEEMADREMDWCKSANEWFAAGEYWVRNAEEESLSKISGFFDFRPVMGESEFAVTLKKSISNVIMETPLFLQKMARCGSGPAPPLGFLRDFVVERGGEYSETINLNLLLEPIIGGARVLAWRHRIAETSTLGRLAELASIGAIPEHLVEDLREAFSFITLLRISRYLDSETTNATHYDSTPATELNYTQRKMLKDSFSVIADFRERILTRYVVDSLH